MSGTDQNAAGRGRAVQLAGLLIANVALAIGPLLVRLADTGPVSAAFWRVLLPLPLFAWLALREGNGKALDTRMIVLVMVAGVFFALDLAAWHIGIELTRMANASLFGNTGSIILMIWGFVVLRRAPRPAEALAIFSAVAGAAILMGRSFAISFSTLAGDLFCLLAGVLYAFYLIGSQKARATVGPWAVLALAGAAGVPVLLGSALALGEPVIATDWTPVVVLAFTSQVVGQGLLVFSLRHFSPLVVGLALLTQPAVGALVGWLTFGEIVTPLDMGGMALLGLALVLARAGRPAGS